MSQAREQEPVELTMSAEESAQRRIRPVAVEDEGRGGADNDVTPAPTTAFSSVPRVATMSHERGARPPTQTNTVQDSARLFAGGTSARLVCRRPARFRAPF
ncbi:hypothetical protein TGME49_246210 [Toxoplasma gondii ME49]|uniref:Uncharacterized protein n=14 Tax=Toxoplasma gondii TaxID=5811 RepID=A0A125YS05_TOXGV|nr:hypothetical protein TGME49_246210 [Toxoplasma gondii ME49]EPR63579.1 hypothetical protein TGGT1_246210 [Toxoplasma gondii GT1]ESS34217.1 hypothetical protein TGVEG_246210 [Toxoplasma gondii VEG]KAF4638457.1 hypothetical protein TGRH88_060650 [Toxoplasma gondii]KFG46942.1 hypothetical protein TGDOM2_246210 [Toxoplasma gondii GAB2-2007-GAL-DOM2]KFG47854.1 hypothetical protein TGP89_246210 [Toxoplasma gondii p89]KFG53909.1 hypothetical protein TGFOU_246210 [Toxoplasma gondii FOU]KFG64605.1 |eukprot:XP_018634914.1 hypothetical protein TGME49_246210 [Toxoplasma gondii ME49]